VYASLEISHGAQENVRALFERMGKADGKRRRAEAVFRRWREWESSVGGDVGVVDKAEREWGERKAERAEKDDE
jgi:rRNA biogenesis protein RRP5